MFMHGTYDSAGNFRQQQVKLGRSVSGFWGFFTNGMLAMMLSDEEFAGVRKSRKKAAALAERYGFALADDWQYVCRAHPRDLTR